MQKCSQVMVREKLVREVFTEKWEILQNNFFAID